jgi:hypothetical protein
MTSRSFVRATVVALGLASLVAGVASAQSSSEDMPPGQRPPAEQQEPAAVPSAAKPDPVKCVTNETAFREENGKPAFVIALTNTCETRQRCTISAYIVTAQGPTKGQKTMTLAPKSKGKDAQRYIMPLKQAGGMANVSQSCQAI